MEVCVCGCERACVLFVSVLSYWVGLSDGSFLLLSLCMLSTCIYSISQTDFND